MNQIIDAFGGSHISPLLATLIVWSIVWKGVAMYRAARLGQKKWYIALLIINTFGILEIIYLFFITGKKKEDQMMTPTEGSL